MSSEHRRPTIIDVAKRADVSFKTVSRVLNNNPRVAADLRSRVLEAIVEVGYEPNLAARSLAGRRGYAIALLVDDSELFSPREASRYFAPYLVDLQAGALVACREAGYHFFLEPYDPSSTAFPGELRAQLAKIAVDGIVLAPPTADRRELLDALDEWQIPYVRIAPGFEIERSPSVAIDEYAGAFVMAEHLLSLGHRRIGFVSGPQEHIAAAAREVAFREALSERADLAVQPGDFTFAGGLAAGERLLGSSERPTAIFAANDLMAAGVVAAATRAGLRVPQDISVAGFDDSVIAHFVWPRLTTVRQPVREMARAAIEYLLARAGGAEMPAERTVLPIELVVRESTGPASALG
jgi:LacI family transcriptional regulator